MMQTLKDGHRDANLELDRFVTETNMARYQQMQEMGTEEVLPPGIPTDERRSILDRLTEKMAALVSW